MALLESLACGLPVVAPRAGVLLKRIDGAVGALIPPRDRDALADAVRFTCARSRAGLAAAAGIRQSASAGTCSRSAAAGTKIDRDGDSCAAARGLDAHA